MKCCTNDCYGWQGLYRPLLGGYQQMESLLQFDLFLKVKFIKLLMYAKNMLIHKHIRIILINQF